MIAAPSAAADITSTAREKPCWAITWPAEVMTSTSRAPASFTNVTSGSSVHASTARVVIRRPPPPGAAPGAPVPRSRPAPPRPRSARRTASVPRAAPPGHTAGARTASPRGPPPPSHAAAGTPSSPPAPRQPRPCSPPSAARPPRARRPPTRASRPARRARASRGPALGRSPSGGRRRSSVELQPAARRGGGALGDDREPAHRHRAIAYYEQHRVARGGGEVDMAELPLRRDPGPPPQPEQLGGARRLVRHAGEVRGDSVGDVLAVGILQGTAQHLALGVEQEQAFLRALEPREHARLFERRGGGGGGGELLRRGGGRARRVRNAAGPATTLGQRQCLRHARVVRRVLPGRLQVGDGLADVADLEIEKGEALQGPDVVWGDAQRHVPLVEGAFVVAFVGEDAGVQVVGVRQVGVPLEAGQRDPVRGVELTLLAQQLPQPQEHQAVGVLGELRGERLDLLRHGALLRCRRASAPRSSPGAPRRAAPARSPSARPAAPTDPTAPPPPQSARWRPARSRGSGARRRAEDRAAGRAAARPRRRRARPLDRCGRAADAPSGRADALPPPARPARALPRAPGAPAPPRRARRARPDPTSAWPARASPSRGRRARRCPRSRARTASSPLRTPSAPAPRRWCAGRARRRSSPASPTPAGAGRARRPGPRRGGRGSG